MVKAIVIIRESTTYQEIESQKKDVIDFALRDFTKEEIEVVGQAGASAIKIDEHYMQIMDDVSNLIEGGGIKCVYAWAIDRIGRNEMQLHNFKEKLVSNKVQLKIINPSLSLLNEDGSVNSGAELAFSLFATMAKQEMEMKKVRFARTKNKNSKEGKFNGGWCVKFGYMVDENNYVVINPKEADLVSQIFLDYATGKYGAKTLAKEYRERGITKPNGDVITEDFIRKSLRDTAYIGFTDVRGSHRNYTPLPSVVKVWDKVQDLKVKANNAVTKTTKERYWNCLKVIKCRECGHNYMVQGGQYKCWLHSKKYMLKDTTKTCNNEVSINAEYLDNLIWFMVKDIHTTYVVKTKDKAKGELEGELVKASQKVETTKALINGLKDKVERIADAFIEGLITKETKKKKLQGIKTEETKLKDKLKADERYYENLQKQIQSINDEKDIIYKLMDAWQLTKQTTPKDKQELVRRYVESIYLAKVEIDGTKYTEIEINFYNDSDVLKEHYYYNPRKKYMDRLYIQKPNGELDRFLPYWAIEEVYDELTKTL